MPRPGATPKSNAERRRARDKRRFRVTVLVCLGVLALGAGMYYGGMRWSDAQFQSVARQAGPVSVPGEVDFGDGHWVVLTIAVPEGTPVEDVPAYTLTGTSSPATWWSDPASFVRELDETHVSVRSATLTPPGQGQTIRVSLEEDAVAPPGTVVWVEPMVKIPDGLLLVMVGGLLAVISVCVLFLLGSYAFFAMVRVVPSLPDAAKRGRERRAPGRPGR